MECRPFKDPSFDKFMIEQDTGIQAIPIVKDTGAQTFQLRSFKEFIYIYIIAVFLVLISLTLNGPMSPWGKNGF